MTPLSGSKGSQVWTSVDHAAINMASKVCCPYVRGLEQIEVDASVEGSHAPLLDYVLDIRRKSRRFRALARSASQSGKRLVVEIHDRNPVKTIASQPAF